MTAMPAPSTWPAPSPADAAPMGIGEPKPAATMPRPVIALARTARRLSSRKERADHAAAKEEQRISDELLDLPAGWHVLRPNDVAEFSVEPGAEHVVIGPGGVFMIYLEHRTGSNVWVTEHKLTIDGRDSDLLNDAMLAARSTSDRLTVECGFAVAVQSVVLLIGAATMQALPHAAEVHVRTQHDIRDWLCRQPVRLDAEMVTAVHACLRPSEPADVPAGIAPGYDVGSSTTTGI